MVKRATLTDTDLIHTPEMDFHYYRSLYRLFNKECGFLDHKSAYEKIIPAIDKLKDRRNVTDCEGSLSLAIAEYNWHDIGCPYVKVFPGMTSYLLDAKLDIPTSEMGFAFASVALRFGNSPANGVATIIERPIQSMLFSKAAMHKDTGNLVALLALQTANTDKDITITLPIESNISLQDCIDHGDYTLLDRSLVKRLMALAISVNFFLLDKHELVAPDIIRRDIPKYEEAKLKGDQKVMTALLEKSKREGLGGYLLGKEIALPRPQITKQDGELGMTHELHWSHMRRGHWRMQPYGNRDNPEYKRKFIFMTQIRPDLPLKPHSGFRIDDSSLPQSSKPDNIT